MVPDCLQIFKYVSCDHTQIHIGLCVFATQCSALSLTLVCWSSDWSLRVPWLTLTVRCPIPLCSASPSASPRLLLANSGHLIKGLVGLMVVSVPPHMLVATTKPDSWTSGRRHWGLTCTHKHSSTRAHRNIDSVECSHGHTMYCRFSLGALHRQRSMKI